MKHKPKILIIEDNKFNHDLYRDVFEQHGFEVIIGADADGHLPEAVTAIAPDIISMDLMIGKEGTPAERDGFEAIAALKSDDRTRAIPIIVLTNFFEEGKVRRAKELGAVDFINSAGQTIQKIPELFLTYLENPRQYQPVHPLFRS
jgi:CheY-like chemotaxis protein